MLFGLVLAAIVVRVGYVWNLPTDGLKWSDEREFDEIGWRLARTGRYVSTPYRATPTLPWFLAAVYRLAGHSYRAARVAQSVLAGMIVLAIYAIGATLFARATGYVAALGVAFYPPLIYLSGVFYAEQLFTILLVATVFCLVKWWETKRVCWVVMAGIGLGLGALCRPVLLGFVPFAAAYVGWTANAKLRWPRSVAVLLAALAVTVGSWTIRNAMTFHHFVPVSTGFGLHLWRGNNDTARGDADDRVLLPGNDLWIQRVTELPDKAQQQEVWARERRLNAAIMECKLVGPALPRPTSPTAATPEEAALENTALQWDLVKLDRVFKSAGEEWMAEHPIDVLRLSGRRLLELYSAFSRTRTQTEVVNRRNRVIAAISFYPVLALGLIGAVIAWDRQRASVVVPAAIVAGTVVYLLMTACTRFRLPLDPLWILLASVAVTSPWDRLRVAVTSAWGSLWKPPDGAVAGPRGET